jgi:hypothetical protein
VPVTGYPGALTTWQRGTPPLEEGASDNFSLDGSQDYQTMNPNLLEMNIPIEDTGIK